LTGNLHPVRSVEPLVKRHELARIMGVSEDTVDEMRKAGMPWIPWGRRLVRFEASACVAWLKNHGREAA
jgi:phage terminase Nu1 subunit (DNA packaging protein)